MYMEALQGEGKEYGKREVLYPDFERTASGLQYKDMVVGAADAKTFLSNCQLMPCIEGMLDGHTKFEERVVLEVLGAVEYVSDCSTGLYTKPSKCKQAAVETGPSGLWGIRSM